MTTFSEKVFQLRKEFAYSQEELAEKLEVSRQTISNWENGTAQHSQHWIKQSSYPTYSMFP